MPTGDDNVEIAVLDDDAFDRLADLYRWLRDDPDLRAVVSTVDRPPGPGEMGLGLGDALTAAVASKELLVALVGGVGGWLVARAPLRRTKVRVRRGEHEIEIDSANVPDPEALVRRLLGEVAAEGEAGKARGGPTP